MTPSRMPALDTNSGEWPYCPQWRLTNSLSSAIDACVRKGFAVRLSKRTVTAPAVLDAVDKLLQDEAAKSKVMEFRDVLQLWDGPANSARFLCRAFGEGQATEAVRTAGAEMPM